MLLPNYSGSIIQVQKGVIKKVLVITELNKNKIILLKCEREVQEAWYDMNGQLF